MAKTTEEEYGVSHERPARRNSVVWQSADGHLCLPSGKLLCPVKDGYGLIKSYRMTETINNVLNGASCKRCRRRFAFPKEWQEGAATRSGLVSPKAGPR